MSLGCHCWDGGLRAAVSVMFALVTLKHLQMRVFLFLISSAWDWMKKADL